MANLLEDVGFWYAQNTTFSNNKWTLNIAGDYAYPERGQMSPSSAASSVPNTLRADVEFIIDPEDGAFYEYDDLYFYILDDSSGSLLFAEKLRSGGDPVPASGTFSFDLEIESGAYPRITFAIDPFGEWGPSGVAGYVKIGELTLSVGEPIPPEPPVNRRSFVYEAERGWTFDGRYIPHYLELNWLFNEDPFTYHEMQKVRIHGLTKGNVDLQVAMSGMQGDATTDYLEDYTEPQFIDLPFTPIHISEDFLPSTNYTDVVSRGIGIQMKFEGRNTDVNLPEPAHAIQVLALQASPQGNGKRAN